MTVIATYVFGAEFVVDAHTKIAKVNARAAKAGLAGYTVEVAPFTKIDKDGSHFSLVEYSVLGNAPKIAGWEFLARIETDSLGVTTTNVVPGAVESDLSEFRARIGECDHCKINRQRNATYVVRHEDGTLLQVGSTCLTAFLGIQVSLGCIGETFLGSESDGGLGYGERSYDLHHFLTVVAAVVENEGWLSRSAIRY